MAINVNSKKLKEQYRAYLDAENTRLKNKLFEEMIPTFEHVENGIFTYLKFRNATSIKEIRQEILIKIFIKIDHKRLDSIKNLVGYINVMTLNETKLHLRSNKAYGKYLKRLKKWTESSGLLWRNNFQYTDDFPQSMYILEYTKDLDVNMSYDGTASDHFYETKKYDE